MARLYLVRHAKPAAAWGEDPDPALDPLGHIQADGAAQRLAQALARVPVCSSPLRRCRETAAPLGEIWRSPVRLLPPVAEIPSPPLDAAARREWLTRGMRGTWPELNAAAPAGSPDYLEWRRTLLDALLALRHDCVIYTHFVAINVAVGAAQSSERVVCFRPDHASVTVVETAGDDLQVLELGREADTAVLTGR
jgi:broad specificity phosphatase PhoE